MAEDTPLFPLDSLCLHEVIYGPDDEELSIRDPRCDEVGVDRCSRCRKLKLLNCFRLRSPNESGSGNAAWCYACEVDYKREWRERDPEKTKQADRAKYEKYKDKELAARRQRYADDPDHFRNKALKTKYGITLAQYRTMLEDQGGVCGLCGLPPNGKALAVDHDHRCCPGHRSCGKCIRGLIHDGCNQGLGLFLDSPALLRAAADYLERYGTMQP